jgi:hypothetical protein
VILLELDVDDRPDDLNDLPDLAIELSRYPKASAPETTSMISVVIEAWRTGSCGASERP